MDEAFLRNLKEYVGLTGKDLAILRELAPQVNARLEDLAEEFYARIEGDPIARSFFAEPGQLERQRQTLKEWIRSLFEGRFDLDSIQRRARVGRIHVQIGLPQHYMCTAMSVLRSFLVENVADDGAVAGEAGVRERIVAINRALDVELAIMLETYQADIFDKLRRNERLATLGALAASVNHELKNPLSVVSTSLDSVRRRLESTELLGADARLRRHLEKMERNLARMSRRIHSLLGFSRFKEPVLEKLDPQRFFDAVRESCPPPEGKRLAIELDVAAATIHADREQLLQLFSNLLENAYHALENREGVVRIRCMPLREGTRFVVEDTGPGIPRENHESVFDPLWTTRPDGTGLGLSICRNIVEAHRGTIALDDAPGGGARFQIDLPVPGGAV